MPPISCPVYVYYVLAFCLDRSGGTYKWALQRPKDSSSRMARHLPNPVNESKVSAFRWRVWPTRIMYVQMGVRPRDPHLHQNLRSGISIGHQRNKTIKAYCGRLAELEVSPVPGRLKVSQC